MENKRCLVDPRPRPCGPLDGPILKSLVHALYPCGPPEGVHCPPSCWETLKRASDMLVSGRGARSIHTYNPVRFLPPWPPPSWPLRTCSRQPRKLSVVEGDPPPSPKSGNDGIATSKSDGNETHLLRRTRVAFHFVTLSVGTEFH